MPSEGNENTKKVSGVIVVVIGFILVLLDTTLQIVNIARNCSATTTDSGKILLDLLSANLTRQNL